MCDTTTPQGVVAVCKQVHTSLAKIVAAKPKLVAVLSQVRDPGNAGTVLRAADAAGADAVVFTSSSVDVYNPKVVRSTTGSLFHLPFAIDVPVDEAIAELRAAGLQIFAADGGGDLIPNLPVGTLAAPTAWVFGNEAWGFEPETLEQVDRVVGVPLYGGAESLNLASAASVCLYASAFAQNS
jgi:TrmH family RNA methyltransferase